LTCDFAERKIAGAIHYWL